MWARAQTRSGLGRRFCACRFAISRLFDRRVVRDVLEHGKAVGRFRHPGEVEAALRTWLSKRMLLLIQFVRLVLGVPAARTDADKAGGLWVQIGCDVFPDRPSNDPPTLGVLVGGGPW